MNYKTKQFYIDLARSHNDAIHGIQTRSSVSAEVVQKRIEHQKRREIREYEKSWVI